MSNRVHLFEETKWECDPSSSRPCIGRLVGVTELGQPMVDFPGNLSGPTTARVLVSAAHDIPADMTNATVLLTFEGEDMNGPIIIGVVQDTLQCPTPLRHDATIDSDRLLLDAKNEVVIRCGKSSITLRKNGKILLSGVEIVSRATRQNRIKGGSVAIN